VCVAMSLAIIFEDSFTHKTMIDAVLAPCGHSFGRETIAKHLESNNTCPVCQAPLNSTELVPNANLRAAIVKCNSLEKISDEAVEEVLDLPRNGDRRGLGITMAVQLWSVNRVVEWLSDFPEWVSDPSVAREQNIDGKAFTTLSVDGIVTKLAVSNDDAARALFDHKQKLLVVSDCLGVPGNYSGDNVAPPAVVTTSTAKTKDADDSDVTTEEEDLKEHKSADPIKETVEKEPTPGGCFCCMGHEKWEGFSEGLEGCSEGWWNCCHIKCYRPLGSVWCRLWCGEWGSPGMKKFACACAPCFGLLLVLALICEYFAYFWLLWLIVIGVIILAVVLVVVVVVLLLVGLVVLFVIGILLSILGILCWPCLFVCQIVRAFLK